MYRKCIHATHSFNNKEKQTFRLKKVLDTTKKTILFINFDKFSQIIFAHFIKKYIPTY